jgi:hypothetical protein
MGMHLPGRKLLIGYLWVMYVPPARKAYRCCYTMLCGYPMGMHVPGRRKLFIGYLWVMYVPPVRKAYRCCYTMLFGYPMGMHVPGRKLLIGYLWVMGYVCASGPQGL